MKKIIVIGLAALLVSGTSLAQEFTSRDQINEGQIYYITTDRLNLRSSDQLGHSNVLGVLNTGDTVRVVNARGSLRGDFVQIAVLETNSNLRLSSERYVSFKFLSACPQDWRQVLCGDGAQFTRVTKVERIDRLGDRSYRLVRPALYRGLELYALDHTSSPLESCEFVGFQNLAQAHLQSREVESTMTGVIVDDRAPILQRGYGVTTLKCEEDHSPITRLDRDKTRHLLVIQNGPLYREFFEARGVRVIQGR